MNDTALRISDTILALFWAVILVRALVSGDFGLGKSADQPRKDRPFFYWFMIFIYALMVVHFGGLAIVGQLR